MRLKSFSGKTMTDAMRQVRATLGDDAIIVSSREIGGRINVTATLDTPAGSPFEIREPRKTPVKRTKKADLPEISALLTETLLRHRVPAGLIDKIIAVAMASDAQTPHDALETALGKIFKFQPLPQKKSASPIVLVGAPGAGKTLCTAKLAARAVLKDLTVSVITTDTARAGGVEQLQAFLTLMDVPLISASNAKQVKSALKSCTESDQILIDTGGLNPFDPQEMRELARILATDDMNAALVMAAGGDAEESAEIALTFGVLGVRKIMPTRLDFARRLGGVLCAADRANMSFTDASHTSGVANGLLPLSSKTLADLLMPLTSKKD